MKWLNHLQYLIKLFHTVYIIALINVCVVCETVAKANDKKMYTITSMGKTYTISVSDATKIIEEAAKDAELEFKRYNMTDKENWYGTAAPYIDFFLGNGLRITELRIGHTNMPISKQNDQTKCFPVEKYGFNGSHHVLLEGSTFPPEKRCSMAQSVGPGTAMLLHIRTDAKYGKKWTDAAKRALSHIPMIDEILDMVQGRKASEIRGLLGTLNDILLITTGRQANRMFFPINFLVRAYRLPVNSDDFIIGMDGKTPT